jgi:hypothetical protein
MTPTLPAGTVITDDRALRLAVAAAEHLVQAGHEPVERQATRGEMTVTARVVSDGTVTVGRLDLPASVAYPWQTRHYRRACAALLADLGRRARGAVVLVLGGTDVLLTLAAPSALNGHPCGPDVAALAKLAMNGESRSP